MELADLNEERSIPPVPPQPNVTGLDLSLTATGVSDGRRCWLIQPGQLRGQQRMQYLRRELTRHCQHADLIVVEGPAFAGPSRNKKKPPAMAHESAGWWWIATHTLWRMGKPIAVVSPPDLKIYITGKGIASKEDVRVHVDRRLRSVLVRDNNEADALVLAAMGYDWSGYPLIALPQTHRRALAKVAWPEHWNTKEQPHG